MFYLAPEIDIAIANIAENIMADISTLLYEFFFSGALESDSETFSLAPV